jgi:hypothetical protein
MTLRTQQDRRSTYAYLKAQGATRGDVQALMVKAIRAAGKEHRWDDNAIGSMLLELHSDLDVIYGPIQ